MTKELYQEFKKTLGYEDPNRMWKGKNAKNWNGYITTVCYDKARCRCSIKKDGVHFPTGLYSRATDFFRAYGVGCSTSDERSGFSSNQVILGTNHDFQVRDYQQEVIDKAVKQQRGIIKVATGGGKTAIGAGIIAKLGVGPFIFYVTSQDLLRQAKSELERFLNISGMPLEVGVIGGGKCDIRDINIMTIQTAVRAVGEKFKKYDDEDAEKEEPSEEVKARYALIADLIHRAKGMICDEVQHWAAETCQVIADHSMNARFRYGLSATPWRDMGDDLLIDACFGKMIAEINASFLARRSLAKAASDHESLTRMERWLVRLRRAVLGTGSHTEAPAGGSPDGPCPIKAADLQWALSGLAAACRRWAEDRGLCAAPDAPSPSQAA
jgi:hypothetical protein